MENDRLIDMIPVLWKWRLHIGGAVFGSMVLMSIVTLLKPNYYKASASFYPVSHTLLQPIVQGPERNFSYFGDDHDVDRLLAIANARETSETIISEFDLAAHYKIDTTSRKGRIRLHKRFQKLYTVIKTKYDGVRISIEDEDPELAAKMANALLAKTDNSASAIIKKTQEKILSTTIQNVQQQKEALDKLVIKITELREKYRVYDTESQGEALATLEAKDPGSTYIRKKIADYTKGVAEIKKLEGEREELSKLMVADEHKAAQIKAAYEMDQPSIHIIEKAVVPEEKSRPRRSLYVLATGLFFLITSCLFALVAESLVKNETQ